MDKRFSERIRTKYEIQGDGCWQWNGAKRNGYGVLGIKIDGTYYNRYAHRLNYAHTYGPIPPHLVVAHKCMNRQCINPSHLELVEQSVNCHYPDKAKLTQDQVDEIRASTDTAKQIAKQYGIYFNHVYKIKRGEVW